MNPNETIPLYPDPSTVEPGTVLLVRLLDREAAISGVPRVAVAELWHVHGKVRWNVGLDPLDLAMVVEAVVLSPGEPFGGLSKSTCRAWSELTPEDRQALYWGALQALASRPTFEREVADAWVREAQRHDRKETGGPGKSSILNRLRQSTIEAARATMLAKLEAEINVAEIIKTVDVTKIMRDHLRNGSYLAAGERLDKAIRKHIDDHLGEILEDELDRRMADTFAYFRRSVELGLNAALSKMGVPKAGGGNG